MASKPSDVAALCETAQMSSKLTVSVQQDHLERLVKSPLTGLAELVWNALDADAMNVEISTLENEAGVLEEVLVRDDGNGITPERAESDFGHLGGSWKKTAISTDDGRALHGQLGQGRWAAYGVGERVRWDSVAKRVVGGHHRLAIAGQRSALREFTVSDPERVSDDTATGTLVTIDGLTARAERDLLKPSVLTDLTVTFALFLQQYPVTIKWNGSPLDPALLQASTCTLLLDVQSVAERIDLVIIEWSTPVERAMHLCDENGVSLGQVPPGIHAPGFEFTAYLRWKGFRDNHTQVLLGEMAEEPFPAIIAAAKDAMRTHFKERVSQRGRELVRAWKADKTYPYSDEPQTPVEQAERDLFEIVAVTAAPVLENTERKARALSLRLIREALETSPDTLHIVLQEVLELSSDQQGEFRDLLERTTLSAVISSTRAITDRLDFLSGLEEIVFDADLRKRVKERSQLHRILAAETWVFREEYALTADDQTLTTALRAHVALLGRDDLTPGDLDVEVLDEHGRRVVLDLMLSRVIEQARDHREHLVIEIKRPTQHVGLTEFAQIQKYATTVMEDARFAQTDTRWEFWIVGDEVEKEVLNMAEQKNREPGVIIENDNYTLRAVTWATIIRTARHRLKFVRDSLDYESSNDSGMAYLRRTHGKYLPPDGTEPDSGREEAVGAETLGPEPTTPPEEAT